MQPMKIIKGLRAPPRPFLISWSTHHAHPLPSPHPLSSPSPRLTQKCTNATETDIAALFDKWNDALQTGNPEEVNARYADNAVLLPTLSNTPRTDSAGRIDYFEHFLAKKPVGTILTRTIKINCDDAVDTGTYNFDLTDPKTGKVTPTPARYTYTYAPVGPNGTWVITSHHSSAMPEKPEPASA